jgi:hypothetical protein
MSTEQSGSIITNEDPVHHITHFKFVAHWEGHSVWAGTENETVIVTDIYHKYMV